MRKFLKNKNASLVAGSAKPGSSARRSSASIRSKIALFSPIEHPTNTNCISRFLISRARPILFVVGQSGSGKSSCAASLLSKGFRVFDLDLFGAQKGSSWTVRYGELYTALAPGDVVMGQSSDISEVISSLGTGWDLGVILLVPSSTEEFSRNVTSRLQGSPFDYVRTGEASMFNPTAYMDSASFKEMFAGSYTVNFLGTFSYKGETKALLGQVRPSIPHISSRHNLAGVKICDVSMPKEKAISPVTLGSAVVIAFDLSVENFRFLHVVEAAMKSAVSSKQLVILSVAEGGGYSSNLLAFVGLLEVLTSLGCNWGILLPGVPLSATALLYAYCLVNYPNRLLNHPCLIGTHPWSSTSSLGYGMLDMHPIVPTFNPQAFVYLREGSTFELCRIDPSRIVALGSLFSSVDANIGRSWPDVVTTLRSTVSPAAD